jgi:toxin ParE1/3/4
MAFQVKYSEQASDDLNDIVEYIHDELENPHAAERFYRKVMEKNGFLRDNPFMYPLHHDKKLNEKGLRFIAINNYILFYIIDEDNKIVNVVRIVYGRRDIPTLFEE